MRNCDRNSVEIFLFFYRSRGGLYAECPTPFGVHLRRGHMNRSIVALAMLAALTVACAKKPTALEACKKIEAAGVGANCRESPPAGLGGAAMAKAEFDLPSVPGKTGQVLQHADDGAFDKTEQGFAGAAVLSGPHRYGNKAKGIFVQANIGLPAAEGQKLKAAVDAL